MWWHITRAFCLGRDCERGEYALILEARDGVARATAVVDVWRTRAPALDGAFDPAVTVVRCSDKRAAAWLAAPEHEYAIAELLLRRAA